MKLRTCIAAAIVGLFVTAQGATVVVPVTADTTLAEPLAVEEPPSNLGAANLGAGAISQLADDTGDPARLRGLMKFDLTGMVPAGVTITSVKVNVRMVKVPPSGPPGSTFELHRALKDWTEGNKGGLIGAPATAGEATWFAPKHPAPAWAEPGASGASDSISAISSSVAMTGLGSYTFPSTPTLIADVQGWLADPASNFGWMMKASADDEVIRQSARRFGSKESPATAPTLEITFGEAGAEVKIQQFELRAEGMFLRWTGGSPPYRVERSDTVSGPWLPVTLPSSDLEATAQRGTAATAFYRVVSGLL